MYHRSALMVRQIVFLFIFVNQGGNLLAQKDRIVEQIDANKTVMLKGTLSPAARPELDRGPVDTSQKLTLSLVLKPSASQQMDMDRMSAEQQDPASPNYHKWLTPDEYASRFGISPADVAKIVAWLKAEGFHVDNVARGRNTIAFRGTAGQVKKAFHTDIHHYQVEGELHFANSTEPSIPAALEPVVGGILGLNDFRLKHRAGAVPKKAVN